MKSVILSLICLLTSSAFAADSFELNQNGKIYTCTEKTSGNPTTGSLSQLCRLAQSGSGQSLYHANGAVFTHSAGNRGASWYYSNGAVITHSAGNTGASWYYSNGAVLTHSAGNVGASWYYPSGAVITHSAGNAGASWYYENGNVMTHNGPAMSSAELLYPCDYIR